MVARNPIINNAENIRSDYTNSELFCRFYQFTKTVFQICRIKPKRGCRNKMKKPFSSDARRSEEPNRKKRLKRNINNLILIPNKKLNGLYRLNFQYKPFFYISFFWSSLSATAPPILFYRIMQISPLHPSLITLSSVSRSFRRASPGIL